MKKLNYLFLILFFTSFFVACDKDKDEVTDTPTGDTEEFSTLSVEENKANLQDDGIALLNEMQGMEETESMKTGASMMYFMDMADPFADPGAKKIMKTIAPIVNLVHVRSNGVKPVFNAMKSITEEPSSIQDIYDMAVGVYDWNSSTQVWDYTKTGTSVVFNFPSAEEGTANDAKLEIKDYVGYTGTVSYIDAADYSGDLPESLKVELSVSNTVLLTYLFDVDYSSEGIPEALTTSLSFEGFVFEISLANNSSNTEASADVSLKHNGTILLAVGAGASGDWSEDNVNNNTETVTEVYYVQAWDPETQEYYDTDEIWYTDEYEVFNGEQVIQQGNAYFQAMNTKVEGNVDLKNLVEKINALYPEEEDDNFDWDAATEAEAALINEYASLKVKYADNNQIIAVMEAYTYEDTYTDWVWDDNANDYVEQEFTELEISMRMKFGDGSYADAEAYFDEGFDDLITELDNWITELENTYGK